MNLFTVFHGICKTGVFVFNTNYVYLQCRPCLGCNRYIDYDWHDENLFDLCQQKLKEFKNWLLDT